MTNTTGRIEEGALNGLWYMALGTGGPLIYLPGFGPHNKRLTGLARKASAAAVKELARDFRVYWINRRDGLKRGASIADMAGDYAEAIQVRFAEPVDVVGYSMGGMLGLQLAADHPEKVRRLVIGGITQRLAPIEAAAIRQYIERAEAGDVRGAQAALVSSAFEGRIVRALTTASAWLLAPIAIGRNWDPSDAVTMLRALLDADLDRRLPDIQARTLVIAGEKDRGAPADDVNALARALADARAITYPGMGHGGTMTSRRFADDVKAFLSEQTVSG